MSGLRKRMQRRHLVQLARDQRADTAGHGRYRRPVASWVRTTKLDFANAMLEAKLREIRDAQAAAAAAAAATTPEVPDGRA